MRTQFIALVALLGSVSAIKLSVQDESDPLGRNVDKNTWEDMHISGFNGAVDDASVDNGASCIQDDDKKDEAEEGKNVEESKKEAAAHAEVKAEVKK